MFNSRSARFALRFLCVYLFLFLTVLVQAAAPTWWTSKQVFRLDGQGAPVTALDFAAANQGQLKNMAVAAYEHFWDHLESPVRVGDGIGDMTPPPNPDAPEGLWNRAGTGWRMIKLISRWVEVDYNFTTGAGTRKVLRRVMNGNVPAEPEEWSPEGTGPRKLTVGADRQDFAALNQGQLKAVADVFYDRLDEVIGRVWGWGRPWAQDGEGAENTAIANLGQLKSVFSFDLAKNIPPNTLTAVPWGGASIQLSWKAGAAAVSSFSIERKVGAGALGQWVYRAEIPAANVLAGSTHTWQDTQVFAGVTYSYRVREHFGLQMSSPSNVAAAGLPRVSMPNDDPADPGTDTDGDGLTDLYELALGLNPDDPDDAGSSDADGNGFVAIFDYLYPPIVGPQGLRITFPDSLVHPKDPDRSKIRVLWNTPSDPAVTGIQVKLLYPGQTGGATPIDLGSTATDVVLDNLLSKRPYQIRVTFEASHGRTASDFIAYEVPAIRGLMTRKARVESSFTGTLVYPNANKTGVPRKMQSYSVEGNYQTTETYYFDPLHQYVDYEDDYVSESTASNGMNFSAATESYTYQSSSERSIDGTPVSASSQSTTSNRTGFTFETMAGSYGYSDTDTSWTLSGGSTTTTLDETLSATLRAVDLSDEIDRNRPFASVSGTVLDEGPSTTWEGTLALSQTPTGQEALWDFTFTDKTQVPPAVTTYPQDVGSAYAAPFAPPPYRIAFQEFPNGLYPEAVVTGSGDSSWTQVRDKTYDWGSYLEIDEFWTQTVTVGDELSTAALLNAAVGLLPDLEEVPWYHPYLSPIRKTWYPTDHLPLVTGVGPLFDPAYWNAIADYIPQETWSGGESEEEEMPYSANVSPDGMVSTTVGNFVVDDEETYVNMQVTKYRYRLYPSAVPYQLMWMEVFTPDSTAACPPNWVNTPQYRIRSCEVNPGDTVTPISTVDGTAGFSISLARNCSPSLTAALGQIALGGPLGKVDIGAIGIEVKIMKPQAVTWNNEDELPEGQVILSAEKLRIRVKIGVKFDSLSEITQIPSFKKIRIVTGGTKPDGVEVELGAGNTAFQIVDGLPELRVELTRTFLEASGLLPALDNDGVDEIAWFDLVKDEKSSTADSLAFEQASVLNASISLRGRSYVGGSIKVNGDHPVDQSFVVSGGSQIINVQFGSSKSEGRQISDQADTFYISGHGSYGDGSMPVQQDGKRFGVADAQWNKDANL